MRSDGFYPSKKVEKHNNRYWVGIDLLPFFGLFLALFFIIMIFTSERRNYSRSVRLAVTTHSVRLPYENREDAVHIAITRDDQTYLGNSKMFAEDMPGMIRELVKNGSEKRIYMVVDERAKYRTVKRVLDEIRAAGIENVSFLADAN